MSEESQEERYDEEAAVALIQSLFPIDSVPTLQALTGVPMKTAKRWVSGETRVPPSLLAKLRDQSARQDRFIADVRQLAEKHAEGGTARAALQGALDHLAEDSWFSVGEDEL